MNIKKFFLYGFIALYVLFFIKFCAFPLVPSRLYVDLCRYWEKNAADSVLSVNLADVTSFEWDSMYYYNPLFPRDSIYKIHNKDFGFTKSRDVEGRLVFTGRGRVVYAVELGAYVEESSRTLFFTLDSLNWERSCQDANFELRRVGNPFVLKPVFSLSQE